MIQFYALFMIIFYVPYVFTLVSRTYCYLRLRALMHYCLLLLQCLHQFLPARRYASTGYSDRNVSVCLSVRHALVLCQNEER